MGVIATLTNLFTGKAFEPSAEALCQKGTDCYLGKNGEPENDRRALEFFARAAEKGHLYAMYRCSSILDGTYERKGVPKNQNLGKALLVEAAERGDSRGQYHLGLYYRGGTRYVEKDLVQAHKWLNLNALRDNCKVAKKCRNELEQDMTSAQIAEAQNLASAWKPKTGALPDDVVQGLRQIYAPTVTQTVKPEAINLG